MKKDVETIEADSEALLRDLLAFAGGRGFVRAWQAFGGTTTRLTPANPNAARIEIYAENGNPVVSVEIGKRIVIEVLGSASSSLIGAVRMVCDAALHGKVEEEVWEVGNETVKSIGKIEYGGRVHVYRSFGGGITVKQATRRQIQYEPYM